MNKLSRMAQVCDNMAQVIGRNLVQRRRNSSSEFIAHMQKSAPQVELVKARFKPRGTIEQLQADALSGAFTRTSSGSGLVSTKSILDYAVVNTVTTKLPRRRGEWIVFPSIAPSIEALVPHSVVGRSIDRWGSMVSDGTYAAIELKTRAHTGSAIDEYGNFKTSRMKDRTQTFMFGQL
eukprot:751083-Hanusia_phi.AAC.1